MFDTMSADQDSARHLVGTEPFGQPCLDANDSAIFARQLTSAFRNHSHINNVLTHIAFGRWDRIEDVLATLLACSTDIAPSSPLARNVLDLLWAEGGITGRIMKRFFLDECRASLSPALAERCTRGIASLASLMSNTSGGHHRTVPSPLPLPASSAEPATSFRRGA